MSQSELDLEILPEDLIRIVASVFETMMNLEVSAGSEAWDASDDRITAAVHLLGAWSGSVMVECDSKQAERLARRFLSIDTSEEVARDVMGEVANMIGGNLKSMLAPDIQISMPLVLDGSTAELSVEACRIPFESQEGIFWVTIVRNSSR